MVVCDPFDPPSFPYAVFFAAVWRLVLVCGIIAVAVINFWPPCRCIEQTNTNFAESPTSRFLRLLDGDITGPFKKEFDIWTTCDIEITLSVPQNRDKCSSLSFTNGKELFKNHYLAPRSAFYSIPGFIGDGGVKKK